MKKELRQKNRPKNQIVWGEGWGQETQNIGKQEITDHGKEKRIETDKVTASRMKPQANKHYTTIIKLEKIGKEKNSDGVKLQLIRKE